MIYAGFWVRIFASIIDLVITTPIFLAALYAAGISPTDSTSFDQIIAGNMPQRTTEHSIADFISYVILISYSVYFITSKKQGTPGKIIMNIHVETKDGQKLSINRAFARFLASMLSLFLFGIGVVMIAFTPEKTGLHDIICGTRVVYNRKD